MKKLFMTVTLLASLLLASGLAQALDPEAAAGGKNLRSPDGQSAQPDAWAYVQPEILLASAADNITILKPIGGSNLYFGHEINQFAIAVCAAAGNTIFLLDRNGLYTGCFAGW